MNGIYFISKHVAHSLVQRWAQKQIHMRSQPLQCEYGTSAWCHRAVLDGKSPARSPPDPTWALIAAYGGHITTKNKILRPKWKECFSKLSEPVPEPVQKSQPAHYQWAGRDIFGWLALLWGGRDLEREEGIRKLSEAPQASIGLWLTPKTSPRGWESPSIRSQSLCRSCMGQASHSWICVLLLCRAAAVKKACFKVSITSSTWRTQIWQHIHAHKGSPGSKEKELFSLIAVMWLTRDSLAHWKTKHTYWLGPDSIWSRQMNPKWSECLMPCGEHTHTHNECMKAEEMSSREDRCIQKPNRN